MINPPVMRMWVLHFFKLTALKHSAPSRVTFMTEVAVCLGIDCVHVTCIHMCHVQYLQSIHTFTMFT